MKKKLKKKLLKAQKEINELKKILSLIFKKYQKILLQILLKHISGDKLNESSIKAAVEDISKKNLGKYL